MTEAVGEDEAVTEDVDALVPEAEREGAMLRVAEIDGVAEYEGDPVGPDEGDQEGEVDGDDPAPI